MEIPEALAEKLAGQLRDMQDAFARLVAVAEREAGVPPLESFPTYSDLSAFSERTPEPLPDRPTAVAQSRPLGCE